MKAFMSAVGALVLIGGGAYVVLSTGFDFSAESVYQSSTPGAVRLSDQ